MVRVSLAHHGDVLVVWNVLRNNKPPHAYALHGGGCIYLAVLHIGACGEAGCMQMLWFDVVVQDICGTVRCGMVRCGSPFILGSP